MQLKSHQICKVLSKLAKCDLICCVWWRDLIKALSDWNTPSAFSTASAENLCFIPQTNSEEAEGQLHLMSTVVSRELIRGSQGHETCFPASPHKRNQMIQNLHLGLLLIVKKIIMWLIHGCLQRITGCINQQEVPVVEVVAERGTLLTDEECITISHHVSSSTVTQTVSGIIIFLDIPDSRLSKCTASIFGKKNKLLRVFLHKKSSSTLSKEWW